MKQRRWPDNAEAHRLAAIDAAENGIRLSRRARETLVQDPRQAEIAIADAMTELHRIKLELVQAKVGRAE